MTSSTSLASDFLRETVIPPGQELDLNVCEEWNPEFVGNGMSCCGGGKNSVVFRRKKQRQCDVHRNRQSYCSEITGDQKEYIEAFNSGKITDTMSFLDAQVHHRPMQAYCTVNDGFLVQGRPIVPSSENLIQIRSPDRCTNFGTEPMAAMIEWLGRQVRKEYSSEYPRLHLLVGDVAAPRGGCLASAGGRRGHKSHSTGQDADLGFLTPLNHQPSPDSFHKNFQPKPNWWFVKEIFQNPYACVKVVFLDHKHISKLARAAGSDPEWLKVRKFIRHIKGHKNHFHVRIGDGPGPAGCAPDANPEDELKLEAEEMAGAERLQNKLGRFPATDDASVASDDADAE